MFSWLQFNKCCQTVYRQQFRNRCQLWRTNNHATRYRMLQHNAVQASKVESNYEMTSLKSRISKSGYITHTVFSAKLSAISNMGSFEQEQAVFLIDCCRRSLVGFNLSHIASPTRINLGQNIMNNSDKTTQVYNALIQLYIENGHEFSPEQMLQDMLDNGVIPNASTYSKLVCAHAINGEVKAAAHLIAEMEEKDYPVSDQVRSYLLVAKLNAGENVDSFLGKTIELNAHIFTLLCCQFCRSGDAELLHKFLSFVNTEKLQLDGYHFVNIVHASLSSGVNPLSMVDEILPFLNENLSQKELNYMIQSMCRDARSVQVMKNMLKHLNRFGPDLRPLLRSIYKSSSGENLMDEVLYLQDNLTTRKAVVLNEALRHACKNEQSLSKTILLEMKRQDFTFGQPQINAVYESSKEDQEKFNQFLSENSFDEKLFIQGKEIKLDDEVTNPGDLAHRDTLSNKKNLKEPKPLLDEEIRFLQSRKNTAEIAESIMTIRSRFSGLEEIEFDRMVLDALVNKMNSMPYKGNSWFYERLKKFMIELRGLGFKSLPDQHYYVHKSLIMKQHFLAGVLLLDGKMLQKWISSNQNFAKWTDSDVQEIIQTGGIDALLKSIKRFLAEAKSPATTTKYLQCLVRDSLTHLEAEDITAVFKVLLDNYPSLPADIANVMLWHFIEMGDSDTVARIPTLDEQLGITLRRFYDISYIPEKLLLSEDEHVQAALRVHLTTTYSEGKADWLYYASFLLSGNVDKCPVELIERLEWQGSLFYQSLFIASTVVDCLPEFIDNVTAVCSRFEKWSRGELIIQCFASLFRRGMLTEAENLVAALEKDDWEFTGKLQAGITEKFHQADRKLPESFQVSDTYCTIEGFTAGGKNFLEILTLVLNPPLSIGGRGVSPAIVGNFFAKLSPEQLEVLDGLLRRSSSKLDPYTHPKVMEARLATLLDQKRFDESYALLKKSAKKIDRGGVDKELWPRIIGLFGKHAVAEKDLDLVRNLYTANLTHGARDRANYLLLYCKLKTGNLSVDKFLKQCNNFSTFREFNDIVVFEDDTELITQMYEGCWDLYAKTGIAKQLYDFTAGLLAHGFTGPCVVDNLTRMRKTCGLSLHIYGKSMMRAKDLETLTHICGLMKEFSPPSAGEQTVLNHQLLRACLHMAPKLNRADKRQLLALFDSAFHQVPYHLNLRETREALPVLRHCLTFDVFPEGLDRVGIVIQHVPVNRNPLSSRST